MSASVFCRAFEVQILQEVGSAIASQSLVSGVSADENPYSSQ